MSPRRRQRGVALITVLLVVAVAMLVASSMIARQHLSIRQAANQREARQAWQYALGGETLAKALLGRDSRESPGIDHPGEAWAAPQPAYPIEQGEIRLRIEDLSGRFNLNSLVRGQQPNEPALAQFRRLLALLEIDAPYAERLVDWLDADQTANGANGAEDTAYQRLDPPYRSAGRSLNDISELRLLLGMQEADYRRLAPHVAALPEETPLNVNSLSAAVLASLGQELPLARAEALLRERPVAGYPDIASFLTQPGLAGVTLEGTELAVDSQFFQAVSEVDFADRRLVLVSLLRRENDGRVRVLRRDLGQPPRLAAPSGQGD